MESLHQLLKEHALTIAPEFNGGFVREGSQWFTGKSATVNGRTLTWAAFGDFARGISIKWTDVAAGTVSPEEERVLNEFIAQAHTENRKAREEHWEKVRPLIQEEWDSFSTLGESPYLKRKGFTALLGCRLEAHERGTRTIVPARDAGGTLWGYQRIYSEKLDIGDKQFRGGARKEACFHTLGDLPRPGKAIYLCEGVATGASVLEALGPDATVITCFDAGNLGPVGRALRKAYPDSPFVFCADNDQWPSRDGQIYYTGEKKAEAAAKEVGNAVVILPQFAPEHHGARPTDWNDVHQLVSIDEVRAQLAAGPRAKGGEDIIQTIQLKGKDGAPKKPSQASVAKRLMDHYGPNLIKQDRELFLYRDGYWQHQSLNEQDLIKQEIGRIFGPIGTIQDIENTFRYMLIHAATAPASVNLLIPPYFAANFRNGTLHFRPDPGGEPKVEFLPHSREDYLTTQLPFEFPGLESLERNPEFDAMLERVFKSDPDKDAKVRVLAQMFGAALMPCYPKIFFLVGPKGSGKSTVCKLLSRIVDARNMSHVDPSEFKKFNMESMVGKLLNMDTDINLQAEMSDSMVKKIIDRVPFRVERKFQTDLLAPLPPIHIFGGNALPKSMEGATGAYERRVIIVTFGAWSAESQGEGGFNLDYDEFVWRQGWQGILAFALGGLKDLLRAKGHYAVPGSSRDALKEWDSRSDPLAQFLDAVEHKEVDKGNQYFLSPDAEISRKDLWECFASWQENQGKTRAPWDAKKLCGALRTKGFREKMIRGVRYWVGIGSHASQDGAA